MLYIIGPLFSFLYAAFAIYFSYIFAKLWRKGDRIAPYFLGTGIGSFMCFIIQGAVPLIFPSGSWPLTFFANYLFFLWGYAATAFYAATISFTLIPKIKPIYFLIVSSSIGLIAILSNTLDLQMATVNIYGVVDRHLPTATFLLLNVAIFISFFPGSMGIVVHSIKSKYFAVKGITFATGGFMLPFFFALSLTAKDLPTFIFLNLMCTIGWILITASFIVFKKIR